MSGPGWHAQNEVMGVVGPTDRSGLLGVLLGVVLAEPQIMPLGREHLFKAAPDVTRVLLVQQVQVAAFFQVG